MAWQKQTKNRRSFVQSAAQVAMADTTTISSDTIVEQLGGKKRQVGINIEVGGTDVVADLELYGSFDGINWIALTAGLIADVQPNVTGVKTALADLTSYDLPYYKLVFNEAGVDVDTTGRFRFLYGV